jgi:hypothetical protein
MNSQQPKLVVMEQRTNDEKPKRTRGAAQMRDAADMILDHDCIDIAEALSTNGKKGQMQSAKFLYDLAKSAEASGEADGARKVRSMALELANAPPWDGEPAAEDRDEDEDD